MSEKKPEPFVIQPTPKICPICGKSSYSSSGIHPQCAVIQADAPRQARLAAEKKKAKTQAQAKNKKVTRWEQTCPKCKVQVHIRRKVCECGYEFPHKRQKGNGR